MDDKEKKKDLTVNLKMTSQELFSFTNANNIKIKLPVFNRAEIINQLKNQGVKINE